MLHGRQWLSCLVSCTANWILWCLSLLSVALFLACLQASRHTTWLSSNRCCFKRFFTHRRRCGSCSLHSTCILHPPADRHTTHTSHTLNSHYTPSQLALHPQLTLHPHNSLFTPTAHTSPPQLMPHTHSVSSASVVCALSSSVSLWQVWVAAVKASTAFIVYQEEEKTKQFFSDLLPQILEVCPALWSWGVGCGVCVCVCRCVCACVWCVCVGVCVCTYVCVRASCMHVVCHCSLSRRQCRKLKTTKFCSVWLSCARRVQSSLDHNLML